jgi:hypothetical protein
MVSSQSALIQQIVLKRGRREAEAAGSQLNFRNVVALQQAISGSDLPARFREAAG